MENAHALPPHPSTSKITLYFSRSFSKTHSLHQSPLLSPHCNLKLSIFLLGKTRPCPSTNPGCVSTNPQSSSFAFPWRIPGNVIQKLQEAMQKNAKIRVIEDAPNGNRHHTNATIVCINFFGLSSQYLQAEVDGGFDRDVLEFFVEGDVVANRSMDTKVTYVYPFTTALGDSQGQEERVKKILDELGWYVPSFYSMD
uniref:Thylakoid lumenal 17.9 kDa protein, chloroplastic n=1 Tax=Populus alba TaxID=43335 RepID=A0A4U5MHQ7_POPAL|nr:hypothetical protein D5086_0000307740 [Populus alba]